MKINNVISTLVAVTTFGLIANANATNPDAEASCPGCHGVIINGIQVVGLVGSQSKTCAPVSEPEWLVIIDRMNNKGCGANNVAGIAKYLAGFGTTTTTTIGTTTTTTKLVTTTTVPVTTTTTTKLVTTTTVPVTTTTTTVPVTTTTTTTPVTTTTTVATNTTTTLFCNTHVNGTTQYPYGGTGSCHGHSDDGTGAHFVRDQKWCQKHVTHMNSSGSHAHALTHPLCM